MISTGLFMVGFMFLMLFVAMVAFLAVVFKGAKKTADRAADRRREHEQRRAAIARAPETSLLRAGEIPGTPSEDLLRAAHRTDETAKDELLRVSQDKK
jgi:hypothetical protein